MVKPENEKPLSRQGGAPTIKDVALLAGVSWRTVSNVVNGHKYLSDSTKTKVEAAIAELGYRPQLAARQLRSGRSNLLTLAVPFIAHPYFARLAHVVVQEAERHGYVVLIDETHGLPEREKQVAAGYRKVLTDGIIFSPITIAPEMVFSLRDETPLVMLGEHMQSDQIDSVVVDNVKSTREATEHLISIGRRRIAFLGYLADGRLESAALRVKGYREALAHANIDEDAALILGVSGNGLSAPGPDGDYSREEGYNRTRMLIPRIGTVDGLVCGNDLLAIGALRALREADIRVPDDVAVVGWDNTPDGEYSAPTLTTIAPDLDEIARLAVAAVLRRLDQPSADHVTHIAPHSLIIRESTVGRLQ